MVYESTVSYHTMLHPEEPKKVGQIGIYPTLV